MDTPDLYGKHAYLVSAAHRAVANILKARIRGDIRDVAEFEIGRIVDKFGRAGVFALSVCIAQVTTPPELLNAERPPRVVFQGVDDGLGDQDVAVGVGQFVTAVVAHDEDMAWALLVAWTDTAQRTGRFLSAVISACANAWAANSEHTVCQFGNTFTVAEVPGEPCTELAAGLLHMANDNDERTVLVCIDHYEELIQKLGGFDEHGGGVPVQPDEPGRTGGDIPDQRSTRRGDRHS